MNISDEIPTDFDSAVKMLVADVSPEEKEFIQKNEPAMVHHSTGRQLRNGWKLWNQKTSLMQDVLKKFGVCHADDASGLLLTALFSTIKGEDVEKTLREEVDSYLVHWRKLGINPATGKEIKSTKSESSTIISFEKDGSFTLK